MGLEGRLDFDIEPFGGEGVRLPLALRALRALRHRLLTCAGRARAFVAAPRPVTRGCALRGALHTSRAKVHEVVHKPRQGPEVVEAAQRPHLS